MPNLIQEIIESSLQQINHLSSDCNDDLLVEVESKLSFAAIVDFLNELKNTNLNSKFGYWKCCCDFLSKRWQGIKNTDAIFSHNPQTLANRAYFIFAQELAKHLNINSYALLMPTVGAIIHHMSRENLNDFKFQEFILGDDGTPIEVAACLENALKKRTTDLYHTSNYQKPLSYQEQMRIVYHSKLVKDYYDLIKQSAITNSSVSPQVIQNFNDAIRNDNYQVTASYGTEGLQRLSKYILTMLKNKNEFIKTMMKYVPMKKWQEFLDQFSTDDLMKIILDDDSWIIAMQKKENYNGDQIHDKAVLFCFAEIYWRQQSLDKKYFTPINWITEFASVYLGVSNLGHKDGAISAFKKFLCSPEPLCNFKTFIAENTKPEFKKALFAISSNLHFLAHQTELIADPAFFQYKESNFLDKFCFWGFAKCISSKLNYFEMMNDNPNKSRNRPSSWDS